jgi:hypothetical protein
MVRTEMRELSDRLLEIIQQRVRTSRYLELLSESDQVEMKIDLLERTLEILRIEIKYLENNLPMEDFIQGRIEIDDDCLHYIAPRKRRKMGSGTSAVLLQPMLLKFLLLRHQRGYYKVYNIIESFVKTIWEELTILDFKKTKTGVTRCFTNTRFAANTLRKYGLLKFTKKEAFKTWVLSLPGIFVASKLVENPNWTMLRVEGHSRLDLHPDIRGAFTDLKNYEAFAQRLRSVCRAGTRLFEEFKEVSITVYYLMCRYWEVIRDESLSKEERQKESLRLLKEIESDSNIIDFYNELAMSLKVGDLKNSDL